METEATESSVLTYVQFPPRLTQNLMGFTADDWEVAALFGVIALSYGTLALGFPEITVGVVTYLCAFFAVVTGSRTIYGGFCDLRGNSSPYHPMFTVVEGFMMLASGLCFLILPGMAAVFGLYVIATWAILSGYNEIVLGCQTFSEILWGNCINGCFLIILGSYLYAETPTEGMLTLLWAVGAQGIIGGIFLLVTSFRLRMQQQRELTGSTSQVLDERTPVLPVA